MILLMRFTVFLILPVYLFADMIMTSVCSTIDHSNFLNSNNMIYSNQERPSVKMFHIATGNHDSIDESDHDSQSTFGPSHKFVQSPTMSVSACLGPSTFDGNGVNSAIFHIVSNVDVDEADQESSCSFGEDSINTFDLNAYCSSDDDNDDDDGNQNDSNIRNSRSSFVRQSYFQQQQGHESCLDKTILSCDESKLILNLFPSRDGSSSTSLRSEETLHFSLDLSQIQEESITEEEEERKNVSGIREQHDTSAPNNNEIRKQVRFESIFIREFVESDCVGTAVATTSSSYQQHDIYCPNQSQNMHEERKSVYRREVCFPLDLYEKLRGRIPVVPGNCI